MYFCLAIQLKGKKVQVPWMNFSLHRTRTKMISRVAQGAAVTQQREVEVRSVSAVKTLRTQRVTWIRAMRRTHLVTAQLFWARRWAIRPVVSDVFFYENHGPTFQIHRWNCQNLQCCYVSKRAVHCSLCWDKYL